MIPAFAGIPFKGTSDITIRAVGSYPAISPLSRSVRSRRYFFCGAFRIPIIRNPGHYPAPCSAEFGLSSTQGNTPWVAIAQLESSTVPIPTFIINYTFSIVINILKKGT